MHPKATERHHRHQIKSSPSNTHPHKAYVYDCMTKPVKISSEPQKYLVLSLFTKPLHLINSRSSKLESSTWIHNAFQKTRSKKRIRPNNQVELRRASWPCAGPATSTNTSHFANLLHTVNLLLISAPLSQYLILHAITPDISLIINVSSPNLWLHPLTAVWYHLHCTVQ